jgi:uncharacterized protein YidB (DUF937 family)
MSRGLTALLGMLAIAGYQNRDKLAEMFRGAGEQPTAPSTGQSSVAAPDGQGGSAAAGGTLGGILGELVESFKQSGQGDVAESWVRKGPNQQIAPPQLEQAIGPDILDTLSQQTRLTREELLARLSRELPDAVDKYTPEGRLPTGAEPAHS